MKKRLEACFSGSVQGVGFRYTADKLARHFEVSGYVRNLKNGQVQIIAEGEETVLLDFLKAVRESSMEPLIRNIEVQWKEAEGNFPSFGIAY